MTEDKFMALSRRFWEPGVQAIGLLGSEARGEAGPFSDVDVVRLVDGATSWAGSHWYEGRLVTVSDATPEQVESWFTEPQEVVKWVAGLRVARPQLDPNHLFAAIQARAHAFVWDEAMQAKANRWVSREMVGWIEEVHKGLEGLRRGDMGRLLNARHGFSWGLNGVMAVYKGVLLSSDNGVWAEVAAAPDLPSAWLSLRNRAFAVNGLDGAVPSLREQVEAGLQLYALTARLVAPALQDGEREMVEAVVRRILAKDAV
jgi:hypothetical protein